MDAVDGFSIRVERDGYGAVVLVAGELDIATAPALRDCLQTLNGDPVTLDLSEVTFLDSQALAVLVSRHKDGGMVVRGVQPAQMQIFELTGLDEVFVFEREA